MINLKGKDILHGNQFSKKDIETIIKVSSHFEKGHKKNNSLTLLKGKILATLFFEPSTRTRLSFETAMQRLGGGVVSLGSVESSSVAKGETLKDTVKTVSQYADVIVIRHPCTGSAKEAADAVPIPIINAGDGTHAHPSQALLDLMTVREKKGDLLGLRIAIIGDISHSRVARSNIIGFTKMGADVVVSGPRTMIPKGIENLGASVSHSPPVAS